MDLQEWWNSQTSKKKAQIDRRARYLDPNADLVGRNDARYSSQDQQGNDRRRRGRR
jgi:hypothetical protein